MSDEHKTVGFRRAVGVQCSQCGSKHIGVIDWPREKVKCMNCGLEGYAYDFNQFIAEVHQPDVN